MGINAVKCLKCEEIIESKHRHDFVTCGCGNVSVDGGKDYCRRVFKSKEYVEVRVVDANEDLG